MTEAAPGSALAALRARREQQRQGRHLDIAIDVEDDVSFYVRLGVLKPGRVEEIVGQWADSKDPDKVTKREAQMLAEACLGVFEVVDGRKVSLDPAGGPWPVPGPELAALIGSPAVSAADVFHDLLQQDDWTLLAMSRHYGQWLEQDVRELTDPGN